MSADLKHARAERRLAQVERTTTALLPPLWRMVASYLHLPEQSMLADSPIFSPYLGTPMAVEHVSSLAATLGLINVLDWCHAKPKMWYWPGVRETLIQQGHTDALKHLCLKHTLSVHECKEKTECERKECKKMCNRAATLGNKRLFIFLRANGAPYSTETALFANVHSFGMLQCVRRVGCPWDVRAFIGSIRRDSLIEFNWLIEHKCPLDSELMARALGVSVPSARMLQRVDDLSINVRHWSLAKYFTNTLPTLMRAIQLRFNTDEVCAFAARDGHWDALIYARNHGCEWDDHTRALARASTDPRIVEWMKTADVP